MLFDKGNFKDFIFLLPFEISVIYFILSADGLTSVGCRAPFQDLNAPFDCAGEFYKCDQKYTIPECDELERNIMVCGNDQEQIKGFYAILNVARVITLLIMMYIEKIQMFYPLADIVFTIGLIFIRSITIENRDCLYVSNHESFDFGFLVVLDLICFIYLVVFHFRDRKTKEPNQEKKSEELASIVE